MGHWLNLRVRSTDQDANTPSFMRRTDETLRRLAPACFVSPGGTPYQYEDGTFEVRVFDPEHIRFVKFILADAHIDVVSEAKEIACF